MKQEILKIFVKNSKNFKTKGKKPQRPTIVHWLIGLLMSRGYLYQNKPKRKKNEILCWINNKTNKRLRNLTFTQNILNDDTCENVWSLVFLASSSSFFFLAFDRGGKHFAQSIGPINSMAFVPYWLQCLSKKFRSFFFVLFRKIIIAWMVVVMPSSWWCLSKLLSQKWSVVS